MFATNQASFAFDPVAEALRFHDVGQWGWFSTLVQYPGKPKKTQRSYPLRDLPDVLRCLSRDLDSWISQGEFIAPNRRLVNLRSIGLLFCDIDTYKVGLNARDLVDVAIARSIGAGLPAPLIVYSGRGLQIKWVHRPIHRRGLLRWVAAQAAINAMFADLGADRGAMDASRVLRVVGTINTKSGEYAEVLFDPGQGVAPTFESLEEALGVGRGAEQEEFDDHPFSESEMAQMVAHRLAYVTEHHPFSDVEKARMAARREWRESPEGHEWMRQKGRLKLIEGNPNIPRYNPLCFNPRRLAWDRAEDLRLLHQMRGGQVKDNSMHLLLYTLNFQAHSGLIHPGNFYQEANEMCKHFGFGPLQRQDELMTLYRRIEEYGAGKTIEFQGKQYPPLYTPRNDTLINLFKITDDEQKQLSTIISKDEKRRRKLERDRHGSEKRRREAGAVPRGEYLARSQGRRLLAKERAAREASQMEIAEALGVSDKTVRNYLKD